jgi:A/G-specific adenine glycosylase
MHVSEKRILTFKKTVLDYYHAHGRHTLPWRKTRNPYNILVSEIMLQQTQVSRVIEKYQEFIHLFPNVHTLARASLKHVLSVWNGLGYPRRALYLHQTAKKIIQEYDGMFPKNKEALQSLPGIGPYTAAAVAIFAYNQPHVCIETNIRTVFIHAFFPDKEHVSDTELMKYVAQTLGGDPRSWYWALMDYGSYLKKEGVKVHRKSNMYVKQSRFKGSDREIRGKILRILLKESCTSTKLATILGEQKERINAILQALLSEKLITQKRNIFYIN